MQRQKSPVAVSCEGRHRKRAFHRPDFYENQLLRDLLALSSRFRGIAWVGLTFFKETTRGCALWNTRSISDLRLDVTRPTSLLLKASATAREAMNPIGIISARDKPNTNVQKTMSIIYPICNGVDTPQSSLLPSLLFRPIAQRSRGSGVFNQFTPP